MAKELCALCGKVIVHPNYCGIHICFDCDKNRQDKELWLVYESYHGRHGCVEPHDNFKIIGLFKDEQEAKKHKQGLAAYMVKLDINKVINKEML